MVPMVPAEPFGEAFGHCNVNGNSMVAITNAHEVNACMVSTACVSTAHGVPEGFFVGFTIFKISNSSLLQMCNLGRHLWTTNERFYNVPLLSDDFKPWNI